MVAGHGVSPNAIVSTVTTVAKGAALVLIPSCLGQLKWNRYQFPTPLYHLQIVDQASRGPCLKPTWIARMPH
jgi:hypothetical protein